MFTNRYRSHHDAEAGLRRILNSLDSNTAKNGHHGASAARSFQHQDSQKNGIKELVSSRKKMPPNLWPMAKKDLEHASVGAEKGGAVYIHVPFCDKICSFCNLNRSHGQGAEVEAYTDYIISEIEEMASLGYVQSEEFREIYFGGGTPSILSQKALERIIQALCTKLPLSQDCEISMETTLHNLDMSKLAMLKDMGVQRFSVGIQTFSHQGRQLLGRSGNGAWAIRKLETLRENFLGILGIDIIYSYPGQTLEELEKDAKLIADLNLDGVSFYSLMIHDGSALAQSISSGDVDFHRTHESELQKHNRFVSILEKAGYEILELSKLVKPGRDEYRYIRLRYDNKTVLPIGRGAGGRIGPFSVYNMAPGQRMVAPINPQHDSYHRMLGQLQYGNYNQSELVKLAQNISVKKIQDVLSLYRENGFLRGAIGNERLNHDGLFWGNNIAIDFMERIFQSKV